MCPRKNSSSVSHVGIDDEGVVGVFSFTATLLPSGTQPGFLANRKVTSPLPFSTPFEPTPIELASINLGDVGQDLGCGGTFASDDGGQIPQQHLIGQMRQGIALHDDDLDGGGCRGGSGG